jgi:hypothetical protein
LAVVLAVLMSGCATLWPVADDRAPEQPVASTSATPEAVNSSMLPGGLYVPAPGEHWQAGDSLAQPCRSIGEASAGTLFRAGPLAVKLEGYSQPRLRLRSGGRVDLRDGVLGVAGGDWVSAADNASEPGETTYTRVPAGTASVTIVEVWDGARNDLPDISDFAAAEIRFADTRPVRWEEHGFAGTDIATAAWFGKSARERFAATGYDPFSQLDGQGRGQVSVTAAWFVPCYYLDRAPRDLDEAHDVVMISTYGDGGFTQYVGYDASGRATAAVLLGYVPWKALGLPGTEAK